VVRVFVACVVVAGACSYTAPNRAGDVDGPPAIADANDELDAPPDTVDASAICATDGLDCGPGGVAHLLVSCTTPRCVVGCRDGTVVHTPDEARTKCIAWGGRLATIESDLEETCIRVTLNGAILLGLRQNANAMQIGDLWERGDGTAATFFRWDTPGQPDDGGGGENGTEQCAFSSSNTRWHDQRCGTGGSARWICER
jgi:hypothetical protein